MLLQRIEDKIFNAPERASFWIHQLDEFNKLPYSERMRRGEAWEQYYLDARETIAAKRCSRIRELHREKNFGAEFKQLIQEAVEARRSGYLELSPPDFFDPDEVIRKGAHYRNQISAQREKKRGKKRDEYEEIFLGGEET